ncbi:MAG TPA: ABC transporter permease [Acidimicrobiia bacterium]|jgi:ABC-type transport system involved in multi-copper enzyme maturation permease subunit
MRAFRSEWIKLSRRNTLIGFGGAMVGFTVLFTFLGFISVGGGNVDLDGGGSEAFVTEAVLALPDGSMFAMTQVASLLGVIALGLFASNMAGEFNKGTIRMLFVTEPNRIKVLAGKLAALASFVALGIAATLAASVGIGALLAPGMGVDTSAWWTTEGLAAIGTGYVNITGAVLVVALIGGTIAVLTRSAAIAISIGAAYFIIGEALVTAFWDALGRWGPSAAANTLAVGGAGGAGMLGGAAPAITYATAAVLVVGYGVVSVAVSSAVLARRDVTS